MIHTDPASTGERRRSRDSSAPSSAAISAVVAVLLVVAGAAGAFSAPVAAGAAPNAAGAVLDGANGTAGAPGTEAVVELETVSAAPGETATVDLRIDGSRVAGYQANVSYDPGAATLVSVDGADFAAPVVNSQPERGRVAFTQSRSTAPNESPVVAATLTFRVESANDTPLRLATDTLVNDESGAALSTALVDGSIGAAASGGDSPDGGDGGSLPISSGDPGGADDDASDERPTDERPTDDADANETGVGDDGRQSGDESAEGDGSSTTDSGRQSDAAGSDATPGFGATLAVLALVGLAAARRR